MNKRTTNAVIRFKFPTEFLLSEHEFQCYCAIKLFRKKYINMHEAMEIMKIEDEAQFNHMCKTFIMKCKRICKYAICDSDYDKNKR